MREAGYRRAKGKRGRRKELRTTVRVPEGETAYPMLEGAQFRIASARDLLLGPAS